MADQKRPAEDISDQETIVALSSGKGVAGVAVIRISGPQAALLLERLTAGARLPKARLAALRRLVDPNTGLMLDQALVTLFPAPASFTGEDVVELHCHGSRAVVDGVLSALVAYSGVRLAKAGEFTRRAFEAGKLDLTEAEALGDLLEAETAQQRVQALQQLDGSLRKLYENWRADLMRHLAHLEADIDFPDEDLPDEVSSAVAPAIAALLARIEDHLSDGGRGEALRSGFRIVILGEPNAGKSTLLNALARSDIAIVSDQAGTTRDVMEARLDVGGFPVRVMDTAGLRRSDNSVEQEGVRRAEARAADADLRLVLVRVDAEREASPVVMKWLHEGAWLIVTQTDRHELFHVEHWLANRPRMQVFAGAGTADGRLFPLSVRTGAGVAEFLSALEVHISDKMSVREAPALTRARHREALMDVVGHLRRFGLNAGGDPVLAAEDVRQAARSLGRITGQVGVEDMLDLVFRDFCIGK